MWGFLIWLVGPLTIVHTTCVCGTVTLTILRGGCLVVWSCLSYMCHSLFCWIFMENFLKVSRILWKFSLYASFPYLVLCPMTLIYFCFPAFSSVFPTSQGIHPYTLRFVLLVPQSGHSLKSVSRGIHKDQIFFASYLLWITVLYFFWYIV